MDSWMITLARHFNRLHNEDARNKDLMVLFDIDGTILDHRYVIYDVLNTYDDQHGTDFFRSLELDDIDVRENSVRNLVEQLEVPEDHHEAIVEFYRKNRWSEDVLLRSHRPFQGVMDVIRWFQLQPDTHVGLNTARPESLREPTLKSLNRIGSEYRVTFSDRLLHMNDSDWSNAEESKIEGVKYFRENGYRVVAMIDNEPENLEAIDESPHAEDVLLLHADKLLDSRSQDLPEGSVSGESYRVTDLIQEQAGPEHVTFVQDGLTDADAIDDYLNSPVRWGNLTIREHPEDQELILRQEDFKQKPLNGTESVLPLSRALDRLEGSDKGLLFDLKIPSDSLESFFEELSPYDFSDEDMGFRTELGHLDHEGINRLKSRYPGAKVQLPVNFLSDVILGEKTKARKLLTGLHEEFNVDELSIDWQVFKKRELLNQLQEWDFRVNLRNVPNLEQFLKATLLLPDSITVNLNRNPAPEEEVPNYRTLTRGN